MNSRQTTAITACGQLGRFLTGEFVEDLIFNVMLLPALLQRLSVQFNNYGVQAM